MSILQKGKVQYSALSSHLNATTVSWPQSQQAPQLQRPAGPGITLPLLGSEPSSEAQPRMVSITQQGRVCNRDGSPLPAVLGGSQAVEQKVLRHTHQPPAAGPASSLLHCILSSSQPPGSLPSTLPPCTSLPMAPPKPSIGCQALVSSLVSSPCALKPHCWELRYDRHAPL